MGRGSQTPVTARQSLFEHVHPFGQSSAEEQSIATSASGVVLSTPPVDVFPPVPPGARAPPAPLVPPVLRLPPAPEPPAGDSVGEPEPPSSAPPPPDVTGVFVESPYR